MPIHTHLETIPIHAHPKPMGMGTQCRPLIISKEGALADPSYKLNLE